MSSKKVWAPNAPRCGAIKRNGEQCKNAAVSGTTVCRSHGGAAPQVRAAGKRRKELEEAHAKQARLAALFGAPRDIEPSQALLDLVSWTAGEVEFWRNEVRELAATDKRSLTWGETKSESGTDQDKATDMVTVEAKPAVEYVMLYAAQDRLAKYAEAALRAGVEERRVRIAEQQGDLVATVIQRILADLDLTVEQSSRISSVVPRHLRALAGGAS